MSKDGSRFKRERVTDLQREKKNTSKKYEYYYQPENGLRSSIPIFEKPRGLTRSQLQNMAQLPTTVRGLQRGASNIPAPEMFAGQIPQKGEYITDWTDVPNMQIVQRRNSRGNLVPVAVQNAEGRRVPYNMNNEINARFQYPGFFLDQKEIRYQQGGQPTAQEGNGEYVLNNLQDFTITQQELDYLNDKDNNYCPGGNCLENTKNAFNKTAGTIPGVKDYYETWEKDLQATSQKNKPTQEQIEEMPWYKGDGNVASVDSWDVQGKIVDSGGTTVYNKNNSDSTYTPGKAAIGSIYSFGPSSRKDSGNKKRNQGYSKEFNLQPSHHSVSVVGFDDESNENILYDAYFREYLNESDLIKKWEDHNLNYELEAIGTPKNYTGLTRENLKGNKYLKQDKTVRPYELDLKKLQPLTEDNEVQYTERDSDGNVSSRQPRFNSSAMKPFVNSLKKNKGVVMDVLNIGNSQYDELANLAVALAMGESEGGAGLSLDFLGETQGLTQLNYENISKDEVLNKSLKKINSKLDKKERITDIGSLRNPSKSAIASLLYLSKVKSRSKQTRSRAGGGVRGSHCGKAVP